VFQIHDYEIAPHAYCYLLIGIHLNSRIHTVRNGYETTNIHMKVLM